MSFFEVALEHAEPAPETVEEFYRQLSLESMVTTNVIAFFRQGLPTLIAKLKEGFELLGQDVATPNTSRLDGYYTQTERNNLGKYYLTYRDVVVQVPEGFRGDFLSCADAYNAIGNNIFAHFDKLITQYRFLVGSFVSDKSQQVTQKDLTLQYKETIAAREAIVKVMAEFMGSHVGSRARLVTVLPQYQQSRPLITAVKTLDKKVTIKQLQSVRTSVRETVEILDVLEKQIKEQNVSEVSPQMVMGIAKGAEEIAKYVEQTMLYCYSAISLVTCVDLMFKQVSELKTSI
jgi:hypothetical protein